MHPFKFPARVFVILSFFTVLQSLNVFAQSAIFNIPSTDVVERKLFYLEADFISNFKKFDRDGFQTYGYRTAYGVSRNLEIGTNFYYTRTGDDGSPKEIQPNFKWKSYSNEKLGFDMSTGAIFSIPLNKAAGTRPFALVYSNASKTFERARGMRVTGGIYTVVGARSDFGTRFGTIVGVEQSIKGNWSFAADWYSGKNQFGYSAIGLNYTLPKRQYITAGYNFSNTTGADNAFSAFYGITF